MPGVVSPRNSHFSMQMTPRQPDVLMNGDHELATWEKCVEMGRPLSYFLGSVLFLFGSIYFYPELSIKWNGKAGLFASWCFVVGCIMFFAGANLDFIQTIRYNHGTQLRQVIRAYNALANYMATSIFILGALYFLPSWYPKAPELGCWSFIVGCVLFCSAAIVEILFICLTHEDPRVSGFRFKNIACWGTVASLGTFFGALFFILGSYYYLPKYINRVDDGTHYMNKAITFYVIGSVFFIINSLALIPDVYRAVKVTSRKNDPDSKV
ncbi:hypothetical protein P3T76_012364 [Phytophthora citrophthora]|uniref:YrhK domain-containing protein n=1 Tax=Phytophthora citrophthora TaxID=4793 RepID=A0AAD9G5S3_9STRA|nr:hypothetical protein P3T76_012364 [Phytophthora citrophthora]